VLRTRQSVQAATSKSDGHPCSYACHCTWLEHCFVFMRLSLQTIFMLWVILISKCHRASLSFELFGIVLISRLIETFRIYRGWSK